MVQRAVADKPLPHNPLDRQCDLTSVTSLLFRDGILTESFLLTPARFKPEIDMRIRFGLLAVLMTAASFSNCLWPKLRRYPNLPSIHPAGRYREIFYPEDERKPIRLLR